jgi:CRISPR-associated protein Cas2
MITWVLYDIENDKARNKIAKTCKQSGLYRVQYSCFLGSMSPSDKDSLQLQIEALIDTSKDKVYIFRMNREQLRQCAMLGQAFDKKLVTDDIKSLFF